jgi:hypothetical protein
MGVAPVVGVGENAFGNPLYPPTMLIDLATTLALPVIVAASLLPELSNMLQPGAVRFADPVIVMPCPDLPSVVMHPSSPRGGAVLQVRFLGENSILVVAPARVAVPEKLKLPFKVGNEPVTLPSNTSDFPVLKGIEPVIGKPPEDGNGLIL